MAELPQKCDAMKIGTALYRPADRLVVQDGREQRLEPRIAAWLDLLAAHPGQTLKRDRLLDDIWGDEGSDEALTQAISRLRHVLGDRSLVRTEPRKGYSLIVEPEMVSLARHDAETSPSVEMPRSDPARIVRIAFACGVAVGLLVAMLVAAIMWPRPVTIFEEVSQLPGEEPTSRTVRCDGETPEACEARIADEANGP